MKKFKIAVGKDQKKYTLVFQAENEIAARKRVHNEGYSILSIQELTEDVALGKSFSFKGTLNGEEKYGKVVGDDIFKVYTKLRKDLGYKIFELYGADEIVTQEEKIKQLRRLEEGYEILLENQHKSNKKTVKKINKPVNKLEETNIDSFYMKKELEQTYKLIDFVLEKVKNLIDNKEIKDLSLDQKEKLKTVYNSIIKIKKTTNINKLKEIGELALLKVGMLEVHDLDLNKSKKMKDLLKDTNKLLKKIGSTKQFIDKDSDYKQIIQDKISQFLNKFTKGKNNKTEVDKTSHEYIRTELLIRKYQEKEKENTIQIIKNIFQFIKDTDYREDILLRRNVIKQNLLLYIVKQKGVNYSYTTIKKGYIHIQEVIESIIEGVRSYLFVIIFIYSIFILLYIIAFPLLQGDGIQSIGFNFKGLFYFVLSIFVYLTLYIKRGFISLSVNFVILFFIVIFGIINF